jgi:hypothetical protein
VKNTISPDYSLLTEELVIISFAKHEETDNGELFATLELLPLLLGMFLFENSITPLYFLLPDQVKTLIGDTHT